MRHGFAVDEGLSDRAALGQFGLDPFRVDVTAEAGDELMFFATLEVKKTFVVELAQVATGPPFAAVRGLTEVAEQV
ncbi:hypothetical protein D3C79_958630 [compost metagenome]